MAKYQARGGGLMRVVFSLLVIAAILSAAEACDPGDPMPMPDGGMTSSSSSSSGDTSSSSSSSSGQMECSVEYVAKVCDECKALGCPMADPNDPDKCHYVAVVMYTDMIGCLQWPGPQVNCPACKGITTNMPITSECESCAKPFTPCSLDCAYELTGGQGGSPP